jgi:iron complex outermembrane recepter protein
MKAYGQWVLATASILAIAAPAYAQEVEANETPEEQAAEAGVSVNEIVVTGTLIRGTEAVGSQTIGMDASAIEKVRAVSTNELLGSIPQITNQFNAPPEGNPRGLGAVVASVRPNLRNFPSNNATSGALTLILLDSMRITPTGANSSAVDPDVIPAEILAGLDIVTDGGSSLYGADAVSGVMNFRTMKKFDGVKVSGDYGFGTNVTAYQEWNASVTAGHSWSTGNAWIYYGHAERDPVLNGDTSWATTGVLYNSAGVPRFAGTQCNTPQPTVSRYVYVPSFGVWTNNPLAGGGPVALGTGCDTSLESTYMPSMKRDNVFASVSNSFSDAVDLRVTGYWTKRNLGLYSYPLGMTSAAGAPSLPFPANTPPGTGGAPASGVFDVPQGVGFALGPNPNYVNRPSEIVMETWGITPELTVRFGDWSVRTGLHFGRSNDATHFTGLNLVQAQCYITGCTGIAAGQLNPLNVATASAAVINDITDWETAQQTTHQLFVARTVADGPIFSLPAGDVKVAVGAEYQNNKDATRIYTGQRGVIGGLPYRSASRDVISLFGELQLPLLAGRDNEWTALEVALSGRYDRYSDFGDTFNPTIGATFKPAPWLKIFGKWGTSFNAPTAYDTIGVGLGRSGTAYSATTRPTVAVGKSDNGVGTQFIVLTGTSPERQVQPQTSEAFAIGFDATPIRGLSFGGEFYQIDLQNMIGSMNPADPSTYQTSPQNYIYNNELSVIEANGQTRLQNILDQLTNGEAVGAAVGNVSNVALVVDTRINNENSAFIAGFDFHLNYQFETSFGRLAFTNNANLQTRARIKNGGVTTDQLGIGGPRFSWTSTAGWSNNGWSAQATVRFSGSYTDSAVDYLGVRNRVDPFVITNLNLGYDFEDRGGWLAGTSVRLIVNNLFDVEPTFVRRNSINFNSYVNWSVGRVIKLGLTKHFGRRGYQAPPPPPGERG